MQFSVRFYLKVEADELAGVLAGSRSPRGACCPLRLPGARESRAAARREGDGRALDPFQEGRGNGASCPPTGGGRLTTLACLPRVRGLGFLLWGALLGTQDAGGLLQHRLGRCRRGCLLSHPSLWLLASRTEGRGPAARLTLPSARIPLPGRAHRALSHPGKCLLPGIALITGELSQGQ